MRRVPAFGAVVVIAGLVLSTPAAGALEVRLSITPARPNALEDTRIALRTYLPLLRADGSCCKLVPGAARTYPFRVEAVSPAGKASRVVVRRAVGNLWTGAFRFPAPGRWRLRVANYGPSYRHAPGARPQLTVIVGPPVPTAPPAGFGSLGGPGCQPASPANSSVQVLRDVFGTAVGGEQLWALPFLPEGATWASTDRAAFDGLSGEGMKIVLRMSAYLGVTAISPDGVSSRPTWGPVFHSSSTWRRPGREWGLEVFFSQTGCWRIHARGVGDLWFLVRS